MNEDIETKELMLKIINKLELFEFLVPTWVSLAELCVNINVKNNTAYNYLRNNFIPNTDYKKKNGKIYVGRDVALSIRKHYEKWYKIKKDKTIR